MSSTRALFGTPQSFSIPLQSSSSAAFCLSLRASCILESVTQIHVAWNVRFVERERYLERRFHFFWTSLAWLYPTSSRPIHSSWGIPCTWWAARKRDECDLVLQPEPWNRQQGTWWAVPASIITGELCNTPAFNCINYFSADCRLAPVNGRSAYVPVPCQKSSVGSACSSNTNCVQTIV